MANDLVVNLALDYSQYQQGLQSSISQNAKFSSFVKVMESQIKQEELTRKYLNNMPTPINKL